MLKAFTASPKQFNSFDFDHIGSGTGVLRYAYGMHLGEKETAEHYRETYEHYKEADFSFTVDGVPLSHDSTAHEVASFLQETPSKKQALDHFADNSNATLELSDLITEDDEVLFEAKRGVIYEASIPDISLDSLKDWDSAPDEDTLNSIASAYYQKKLEAGELNLEKLQSIDLETDYDDFEYLVDEVFDKAYEAGLESGDIGYSVDEEALREVFWQKARGDEYTESKYADEFSDGVDSKYVDVIKDITKNEIDLVLDMSYGDVYNNLTHALNPNQADLEKNIEGKRLASNFLAQEMEIQGFQAPTMYGREGAKEIILIDKELAEKVELNEPSVSNRDYESNLDLTM